MAVASAVRFWNRVDKSGECWEWRGYVHRDGYGMFSLNMDEKPRGRRAHRYAWELEHGTIPAGMLVCHHCDNPKCVRLSHLFLGTDKDNCADRERKGRGGNHKGEAHGRALLTDQQVLDIRANYALCRVSRAELAERYNVSLSVMSAAIVHRTWRHLAW